MPAVLCARWKLTQWRTLVRGGDNRFQEVDMSANALLLSNSKASGPWEEAVSATLGYKYVMVWTHTQTDTHAWHLVSIDGPLRSFGFPFAHLRVCGGMYENS